MKNLSKLIIICMLILVALLIIIIGPKEDNCLDNGKCIKVCNVLVATIKANEDLLYYGMVQYKGELVSYPALQYALENCNKSEEKR